MLLPENFFDTKFTCAPIAPAHVVYPLAILVNTVWFGTFVGFFWYYSSPSMYLVQTVISKDYSITGYDCVPLGYDDYYQVSLSMQECRDSIRAPTAENVILNEAKTEYSFIPFDPTVVKIIGGDELTKSLYNPVGGGTSMMAMMMDPMCNNPGCTNDPQCTVPASCDEVDDDEPVEYAGLVDLSECGCNMIITGRSETLDESLLLYGSSSSPFNSACSCCGAVPPPPNFPDYPTPPSSNNYDPGSGWYPPSSSPSSGEGYNPGSFGKRKLLQDSCSNLVHANAVAMYAHFMTVNDPCDFVTRNSPFSCIKKEPQPLIQRLSLSYANCELVYTVLAAIAVNFMYATKRVTHQTVDIERLQKMSSMKMPGEQDA